MEYFIDKLKLILQLALYLQPTAAAEAISSRGDRRQRQSAVEGRRQWHQQVCVVVSPPGKIRLALPAEFFKRGAATGVGSGGWGCREGEEPASRARDASRATRRRRPSRWSPWRSSLGWAAGQLTSVRTVHVRSGGAARLRVDDPHSQRRSNRRWATAQVVARSFYGGCWRWLRRPLGRRRKKHR